MSHNAHPQVCLVVLMGLPGAGKTTFSEKVEQRLNTNDILCQIYHYDDKITDYEKYSEQRYSALYHIEQLIKVFACLRSYSEKHVVLVDDNMYYRSMRQECYKVARKYGISFLQVHLDVELETALTRNGKREGKSRVPVEVIETMAEKFEVPKNEQWESNLLTINANVGIGESVYTQFLHMLNKSFQKPIAQNPSDKTGTLPLSTMQIIDLALRKIVSEKVSASSIRADKYNARKKQLYEDIRKGKILVDTSCSEPILYAQLRSLF